MPQTHIYLFHNLFLFMPQPLCYRVIYNFFFPFYYFFKLLGSHFWFVMISLPQETRSPIFTLLTIHLFLCDSPDSMYFQQLCDTFATEFQQDLRHCISPEFMLQLYLCRRVQNHDVFDDDRGGTYCLLLVLSFVFLVFVFCSSYSNFLVL